MMLLLDEPTSSVDTDTERQIRNALLSLTAGRTTIVVAHRLSTIVDADIILVIDNGIISDEGLFVDLLKAKCRFYVCGPNSPRLHWSRPPFLKSQGVRSICLRLVHCESNVRNRCLRYTCLVGDWR